MISGRGAADGNFVNLSNRGLVGTGDDVRIVGFIIEGDARQVLIQALGPELANRGIANALVDPVLTVIQTHEGEPPRTPLASPVDLMVNHNWEDSQGQLVSDLWGGSPPLTTGSLSSAVVLTLEPGGYTAKVEGKNETPGVALVEVFRIASDGEESPDRETLTAFYNAMDGANWTDRTNWLSDEPLGEWYGVTVDDNGRVIELGLDENQLSGPIPPELGSLANLEALNLGRNALTGSIPPELGNLANLEIFHFGDNGGLCAANTDAFTSWLLEIAEWSGPRCVLNLSPLIVSTIPGQTLVETAGATTIRVGTAFSDPDSDALTFSSVSADEMVARIGISGATLSITPVAEGATTVSVTAADAEGLEASLTFLVTVERLAPRSHNIIFRVVHVTTDWMPYAG